MNNAGGIPDRKLDAMEDKANDFWSKGAKTLLKELGSSEKGLSDTEAAERLERFGPNTLEERHRRSTVNLFFSQFRSPIILLLIVAAIIAVYPGRDYKTGAIILVIVSISGLLGFWQEKGAEDAVEHLLKIVQVTVTAVRGGQEKEVPVEQVAPGDVVKLTGGSIIPGDAVILESRELSADESALTGETFPVEKQAGTVPADTPLSKRTNSLFMGTHVVSGDTSALVVHTGKDTEFGHVSERLRTRRPKTEFERGIMRFGYLLMTVTVILVIGIFVVNIVFHRPLLTSFLFSLALAVGVTPQLLPAIISINLSKGARVMAAKKVIVKRLESIENFGSMNVFCSDKTGTLTEGKVTLDSAFDIEGGKSDRVMLYAYLNSRFETSFQDPIDEAIRAAKVDEDGYEKLDELPYDFKRKRLSVLLEKDGKSVLISKGATEQVLAACDRAEKPDGSVVPLSQVVEDVHKHYREYGSRGLRTLGLAYKEEDGNKQVSLEHEKDMVFLGMVTLADPVKEDIEKTVEHLEGLGVSLKVITGDNALVASSIAGQVGLKEKALTGEDIQKMEDKELAERIKEYDVFAEIEPNQKEQIIRALQKAGNTVGYMGDGINDAPGLHAADASISVDSAVDVAKEAADFVLLEKDLDVLIEGVREGRTTFANTIKYVFMATSANFGGVFSMASASLFLKFLPLLPPQVLLNNLLTDMPALTIATDRVDPELVERPHRWDVGFIERFMLVFGLLSSSFDYMTFGVLLLILHANEVQFHTGWFVESVVTSAIIVLVIRTRRPFFRSRPGKLLFAATMLVSALVLALPYTPLAGPLGFTPPTPIYYAYLAGIMALFIIGAEVAKKFFYRWVSW